MPLVHWSNVSIDTRNRLLAIYEARDTGSLTQIAEALGYNLETLERYCRQHREQIAAAEGRGDAMQQEIARIVVNAISPAPNDTPEDEQAPPRILPGHYRPSAPLTDITKPDPYTDQAIWLEKLASLRDLKGRITVMHFHDIHAPFQHKAALEVAYRLAEYAQPDVITVGSDSADFTLLSSFDVDPDDEADTPDELEAFAEFWEDHIARLRELCPNAIIVFIYGNHEFRIIRFIRKYAPALRHTVLREFRQIVEQDGEVLYLGEVDWVRIGPLLVMHGNRHGKGAARATYDDVGGQVFVQFGHGHDIQEHIKQGEDFDTGAVMSGCLCHPAHYQLGRGRRKWLLGTSVTTVDLHSRYVRVANLRFQEDPDRVWVEFERKVFQASKR